RGGGPGRPQRGAPAEPETAERARGGQRLERRGRQARPGGEILQVPVGAANRDPFGRQGAQVADGGQAEPDRGLGRVFQRALQRGQRVAGVHVHAVHGDPVPAGVVDQAVRGVEPHRLVAQQRGGERGRVVPFQPRAGVYQVGEADRVRLGEPVVGEGQDLDVDV